MFISQTPKSYLNNPLLMNHLMIQFQEEQHTDKEIYNKLSPLVAKWFKAKFKTFEETSLVDKRRSLNSQIGALFT